MMKTNIIKTITVTFFSIFMLTSVNLFAVTEHIEMIGGDLEEERSLKPTYIDAYVNHNSNQVSIEFYKAYGTTKATVVGLESGTIQILYLNISTTGEISFQLKDGFTPGEICRLELNSTLLGLKAYGTFVKR